MLARSLIAGTIGFLVLGASLQAQEQEPADDPIVAVVDGIAIRRTEVETVAQNLPDQMRQLPLPMVYGMLLDRVIDFRLLANEAERLEVGEDETVQLALARARADVLRDALVRRQIEEGSTEEALQARYEELKQSDEFVYEEVHARHILLASEEDGQAVIEELAGGADFAELATERSTGPSGPNGGDLGYFREAQMVPEFAAAAFAMEVGTSSEAPVKTEFGWHVILVEDRRSVEPTFEDAEPQLRQDVAREIVTGMVDDLRANAEIERFNLDGSPMEIAPEQPATEQPAAEAEPPKTE